LYAARSTWVGASSTRVGMCFQSAEFPPFSQVDLNDNVRLRPPTLNATLAPAVDPLPDWVDNAGAVPALWDEVR